MKTTVTILKDIERPGWSEPFYRRVCHIRYDSAAPVKKKIHQLIYQQGPRYGTIGDKCEWLTHDELLDLERRGFVRINGRVDRSRALVTPAQNEPHLAASDVSAPATGDGGGRG